MPRKKKISVYVINIKLQSKERSGNQAYQDIVAKLHSDRITIKVDEDHAIYLRSQFSAELEGNLIIYGKMTRFLVFQKGDWFNVPEGELVDFNSPESLGAKPKDTNYFFIPAAHRFVFVPENGFSVAMVNRFLEQALPKVINENEQVDVVIQQSLNSFEEIYNAYKIEELKVHLSYSNNDIFSENLDKQMDDEIRDSQITDFVIIAKSEVEREILLSQTPTLRTALNLAKSGQGTAEAKLRSENGKVRKINTSEYPEKVELDEDTGENNLLLKVLQKIMSIYRNAN